MLENNFLGKEELIELYRAARHRTEQLCQPLMVEDYGIQTIAEVSPPKWHLAHTTWFFETFVLIPYAPRYKVFHSKFHHLFKACYQVAGKSLPKGQRGLLSRPPVNNIYDYRLRVDEAIMDCINQCNEQQFSILQPLIYLGVQHEQQHQELLLIDIKHNFSIDPNFPSYNMFAVKKKSSATSKMIFYEVEGGTLDNENAYDNFDGAESSSKTFLLKPFAIANRLVTNEEFCEFIMAGGYQEPAYWDAKGWRHRIKNNWCCPLYWHLIDENWYVFTLSGLKKMNPHEPVAHISYYEADAFARWQNKRLPLEKEWQHFVAKKLIKLEGNFFESLFFHPSPANHDHIPQQFFGDVWEWTATPYLCGSSCGQIIMPSTEKLRHPCIVLKGGCCVTPVHLVHESCRQFFSPEKRWQFSGIRLATDV